MKIKEFKNGAYVTFESNQSHDVPYVVKMYTPDGFLADKIRTDDYQSALGYLKSFGLIAKGF